MSGLIKQSITILSGTTNNNVIAGEIFELLQMNASVRPLFSQEIVAGSDLVVDMNLGNVIGATNFRPNIAVAAGVVDRQRDGLPAIAGRAGDRIQLRAREVTGGVGADGILNYMLEISDIM